MNRWVDGWIDRRLFNDSINWSGSLVLVVGMDYHDM
jgi:hypothetical protein